MSDRRVKPVSEHRCSSPASVTVVPSSTRDRRRVRPLRDSSPVSETDVHEDPAPPDFAVRQDASCRRRRPVYRPGPIDGARYKLFNLCRPSSPIVGEGEVQLCQS